MARSACATFGGCCSACTSWSPCALLCVLLGLVSLPCVGRPCAQLLCCVRSSQCCALFSSAGALTTAGVRCRGGCPTPPHPPTASSIGLNSDEVHLLPGTDPRNSKLFFTELNEEQVNTVVSQFGSKPRFQIQPVEWYRGASCDRLAAVPSSPASRRASLARCTHFSPACPRTVVCPPWAVAAWLGLCWS